MIVLVLAFGAIGFRLVDLQAIGRERYAELAVDQRIQTIELPAQRGSIFDRNGNELAISVEQQTVWADPRVITDPALYASALAPITGVDQAELQTRLSDNSLGFVYVARQVDDAIVDQVKALDLPGVGFQPEAKRFYPSGALAASVVGMVGLDSDGLAGLESGWEEQLAGQDGSTVVERDPQGRELPGGERDTTPAQAGTDLVLSLDRSLQFEAERALTEQVSATDADGGMAIVVDTLTGDILAMANVDGATEDQPAAPATAASGNAALQDQYEPGSTNKVITVAGAIEDGVVTPDTWFDVPSVMTIDGTDYQDEEVHDPSLQVRDIIRVSSNVGTIKIAQQLGKERFDAYLRAFGYGQVTGTGYPAETPGTVLSLEDYNDTSLASMPVGNGLAVSAMQMLDVYSTIANGGTTVPPRLVTATVGPDGTREDTPLTPGTVVVSPTTAAAVTAMLESVVTDGTGHEAAIPGYRVAGKTGTAEKPPYEDEWMASFAGFAPAENPRLAAIVILDAPKTSHLGGEVAAPVFARIMQYALAREHVAPSPVAGPPEAE